LALFGGHNAEIDLGRRRPGSFHIQFFVVIVKIELFVLLEHVSLSPNVTSIPNKMVFLVVHLFIVSLMIKVLDFHQ
jgi:hypothetical protein